MKRPPAIVRALLGALVALAVFGAAEGLLALLGIPDPGLYEGDPATLWYLRPDLDRDVAFGDGRFHVRTNELGLRGGPLPEGPWTLALGCSTTFGWGVEGDEAWPSVLGDLLGSPVVNGGVPGWSTEQARRGAGRWLELGPERVLLAYIVRDAQLASRPDQLARPTPWVWRTHLAGLLRGLNDPASGATGHTPRVPPDRYADNLRALARMAGDAEVVLLAFPQQEPAAEWVAAMEGTGLPLFTPELPEDSWFPDDPVHLDPEGHRRLAEWLAREIRARSASPGR